MVAAAGAYLRGVFVIRGVTDPMQSVLDAPVSTEQPTLIFSAFAVLKDPLSRTYYDRKRAQGKKHNQALMALARYRCGVIYAVVRDGTLHATKPPAAA